MRRAIAAITVTVMVAGCAHVHPCDPAAPGVDLDDVNTALADRPVRVSLVDGTTLLAHSVVIGVDSTSLIPTRQPRSLPPGRAAIGTSLRTSEIATITVTRHGRGALEGTLLGLGIGAGFGFILGVSTGGDEEGPYPLSAVEVGLLGAYICGVLAAGAGLLLGVVNGSKDVYDLTEAPRERPAPQRR